jgi:hypothetical protein
MRCLWTFGNLIFNFGSPHEFSSFLFLAFARGSNEMIDASGIFLGSANPIRAPRFPEAE